MEDLKIVNADNLLYTSLDEKDITPQYLTKLLNEYSKTILLDNKICFKTSRTSTSRLVNLKKDKGGAVAGCERHNERKKKPIKAIQI